MAKKQPGLEEAEVIDVKGKLILTVSMRMLRDNLAKSWTILRKGRVDEIHVTHHGHTVFRMLPMKSEIPRLRKGKFKF